ncbi:bifunctional DNA primase/polymerase [Nonomuraea sp. NPDC050540]|uniref:bifunctional DNA primase/polymerase n=1 Tax=Nonomuraea sp. NPDC050540 TaxID=3364367 RepID=UPI0037B43C24
MNTCTRYALAAAARGWRVFPLAYPSKVPIQDWPWRQRHTTDPDAITRCWQRHRYNIGIACGPSNLVVIDLDTPKPDDTPPPARDRPGITDGTDVFAALCAEHGQPLPLETFQVRTRRGGLHLYYTAPHGIRLGNTQGSRGGLGWLIDTRAHGGYVVGPGSFVDDKDGTGTYEVLHGPPAAPLPGWLADLLRPRPLPEQKPVTIDLAADRRGAYLRAAVQGELDRVLNSPEGGHNNALYVASVALGQLVAGGELSEHQVTDWLTNAGVQVGQPYRAASRTVTSGLRAGARRPRTVAA